MREILFRGKSIILNKWIYGSLIKKSDGISNWQIQDVNGSRSDVDPETIGQFTGITDKDGTKVFEGDIFYFKDTKHTVYWCDKLLQWRETNSLYGVFWSYKPKDIKVIGNIHDNPEL